MKNLVSIFLVIISLILNFQLKASYFAAGEITYTCLGGNTYLISAAIYRDCSGAAAPTQLTINFSCGTNTSNNFSSTLLPIPGTGQEVTPGCSVLPTTCSGGTEYGVREYVYQGAVTLIPCANWVMSIQGCCRNPVNTVYNNQNNQFYISAFLNNLIAPCNSSPTFSSKPIAFACTTMPYCFSHGAVDLDGDSLVYSFSSPNTTNGTSSVNYLPPYAVTNFIGSSTPITMNPVTGDICFTPVNPLLTITGVKIEEYRTINGSPTLIGIVYREIQLKSIPCPNNIPTLSGMDFSLSHHYNPNDTIYSYNTIAGNLINFDINGFDADTFNPNTAGSPEVFHIYWNNGIPAATFSPHYNGTDSAYANFQWTPTSADVSATPKCFIATVYDHACPYYGSQPFSYCIQVNTNTGFTKNQTQTVKIQIAPNPSNGNFSLIFENKITEPIYYQIINPSGQIIENGMIDKQNLNNSKVFYFNRLSKGVYFIQLKNNNFIKTERIIIQ